MSELAGPARALRPLLLCADDFGLAPGVDRAIAGLVRAGRLGAFSCLSNGPAWAVDGRQVAALRPQAQAGLHFNLTEGRPLSPALARHWPVLPSLPRLLVASHLGRLPQAAVADELAAQWQAFVDVSGGTPDFIDGHQHVHHLPGVRRALLAWLRHQPVPVRSTARLAGPGGGFKQRVIERTGGRALARALARQGVPHNALLLGAYGFDQAYRPLMQAWLARVPAAGALLFCHPGQPDAPGEPGLPDVIGAARQREWAYLASDGFPQDLAAAGVTLAPLWR